MEQNLNDKPLSNMQITRYIESLKKEMNFDDEVYGLVKSDLEDGLTQEQTEKYLDKNFNIGQMKVLSEGLHKGIPEELFNILHNNKLSGNQMKVSLEFYEKGVPVETIQEAVARGEKPVVMRRLYEEVFGKLSKAKEQYPQDSEYVKELIAQMEMVVKKINYQEERYDVLNKKLSDVEVLKEDKEVTERLVKENEDKDGIISHQQDELNKASSTIARLRDNIEHVEGERKAYCNNQYGLTEYTLSSVDVKVSYKNRNGERVEDTVSWRDVYEILSYMVKQPFYCGEDQKAIYQTIKNKIDRETMNPVYRRFFDIEDSIRQNRLENRERAIANGWNTKIDADGHIISDDKKVLADISQNDTEPQEAATETPVPEVLPPVEGESGKEKPQKQPKINFHYNLWETEKGGAKTRYQWNIDAIRTLKQIEAENRLATQEEQAVLSKFVGWGGLSQAFDENNAAWSKEYAELKELLSDEEYSAARATVNNAFYTSPEIATCINSALVQFGFKGGNVLEPSMGIGNFFGSMPAPMQQGSNIKGLARIYFENSFIVNNVNILQGKEKIFVSMPSYKTKQVDENGKPIYQDVCYPVTKDFREKLYNEIIAEYEKAKDKSNEKARENAEQNHGNPDREKKDTPFR